MTVKGAKDILENILLMLFWIGWPMALVITVGLRCSYQVIGPIFVIGLVIFIATEILFPPKEEDLL